MCLAHKARPILILTRPEPESTRLAQKLQTKGFSCLINPLLRLESLPFDADTLPDAQDMQGFIASSPSVFRFFTPPSPAYKNCPVYVTGEKTAYTAQQAGFINTTPTGGTGEKLFNHCVENLAPDKGVLVWLHGKHTHIDFSDKLANLDFSICPIIVYDSISESVFNKRTLESLNTGTPHGICLFSSRTAQSCARAIEDNGLNGNLGHVTAYCLSEAVTEPIRHIKWRDVQIARRPNEDSFIRLLSE